MVNKKIGFIFSLISFIFILFSILVYDILNINVQVIFAISELLGLLSPLMAITGLILSSIYLVKTKEVNKNLAIWGLILSIVALLTFGYITYNAVFRPI